MNENDFPCSVCGAPDADWDEIYDELRCYNHRYEWLVQVHGEWSGIPEYDWMDIDFECKTEKEARELIRKEVPKDVPYILYHKDFLVEEGIGV